MPHRIPTLFAAALLLGTAGLATPGRAASESVAASQSDEDACRPDVFRLCSAEIPNETAIVACLNARLTQLSPACHAVMAPAPTHARKHRAERP